MAGFVQIIEFETDRIDEVRKLTEQMRDRDGEPRVVQGMLTHDRDHPNSYISVIEFPSYEMAQENNADPVTQEYAARMEELCNGPARFHNLDMMDRMR